VSKRKRTNAEQRRDTREAAIRRVMSLVELYAEMAESWLVAETFDAELVRRMLATRESVLALIEAAMPLPLIDGELDDVRTESRAIH
jgi:phage gp46-like protein